MTRAGRIAAAAGLAVAVAWVGWAFVGWTEAPVVLAPHDGACGKPNRSPREIDTFRSIWNADGSLTIRTTVALTGGARPVPSSAKALWRGSQLRLSYSTKEPAIAVKCLEHVPFEFRVTGLPKRDYEVQWRSWFIGL